MDARLLEHPEPVSGKRQSVRELLELPREEQVAPVSRPAIAAVDCPKVVSGEGGFARSQLCPGVL